MIFVFSDSFIRSTKSNLLSDLVSEIVQNNHYLSIPGDSADYFFKVVGDNASTSQKEVMNQYQGFSITTQIRTYLTTVDDAHFSYETLFIMASKPMVMVMENTREWAVYKRMIDLYRGDPDFGNLFKILYSAVHDKMSRRILPHNAGGSGDMVQSLRFLKETGYGEAVANKVFVVFDRDEKGPNKYNAKYKNLFMHLSGKDNTTISEQDIYTLNQPMIVWHMWYRRELENYFPDIVYEECGFPRNKGVPPYQDDFYASVKDYFVNRDTTLSDLKNSLDLLASKMTLDRFESGLRLFSLRNVSSPVSEIKLFLLKLLRVL